MLMHIASDGSCVRAIASFLTSCTALPAMYALTIMRVPHVWPSRASCCSLLHIIAVCDPGQAKLGPLAGHRPPGHLDLASVNQL